jgi:hypothetical protein
VGITPPSEVGCCRRERPPALRDLLLVVSRRLHPRAAMAAREARSPHHDAGGSGPGGRPHVRRPRRRGRRRRRGRERVRL